VVTLVKIVLITVDSRQKECWDWRN